MFSLKCNLTILGCPPLDGRTPMDLYSCMHSLVKTMTMYGIKAAQPAQRCSCICKLLCNPTPSHFFLCFFLGSYFCHLSIYTAIHNHLHSHSHLQLIQAWYPNMHVTGRKLENPHRHKERVQTPHVKARLTSGFHLRILLISCDHPK